MAIQYIVDVSSYNGSVNWASLKQQGITGGILKIIRKDLARDNQFNNNYNGVTAQKMPWGVYNYSYATTASKARSDMTLVCDILDKLDTSNMRYGVWFDIEDTVQASLSKAKFADIINAAQTVVESRGYKFGVYTGMAYYKAHMDGAGINCQNWWIARYYNGYNQMRIGQAPNESYKPTNPPNICAWQYSSSVVMPATGNGGVGDMSVLYHEPVGKTASKPTTTTTQTTTVKSQDIRLGSARIDENGNISGGKAGDQTGREVMIEDYYRHSYGWIGLRAKDPAVRAKLAYAMEAACANNDIGYDQGNRNTLYIAAEKVGFDPSRVKVKCETDCSALVRVCCAYAGIRVGDFNTATEKRVLMETGKFEEFNVVDKSSCIRGDILITARQGHTVICVGGNVTTTTQTSTSASSSKGKAYTGTYPALPPRGFYQKGDGITTLKDYPTQIKRVQMLMNWCNGGNIAVDGKYGDQTVKAVNKFKKKVGLKQDGCFNKSTLNAAKAYRK